jgi:hypothetical protein
MKPLLTLISVCALIAPSTAFADWTTTTSGQVTTTDVVGIGTTTPGQGAGLGSTQEAPLHVVSTQNKNTIMLVQNQTNSSNVAPAFRTLADVASQNFQSHASSRTVSRFGLTLGGWNEFLSVTGNGLVIGTYAGSGPLVFGTNSVARITILASGNMGIGTTTPTQMLDVAGNIHAVGDISADGALYAKFQDVAEWVPSKTNLTAGTVVVLNPEHNNEVMASHAAYDTTVAGVVSAQPGLSLGVRGEGKEQIATTGRVKVRVDSRSAPIRIGDLLVTSDRPGTAMRSEPMDLNGRKFHQPGTIIGKALEPHAGGEGEILVLLSLQ